MARAVRLLVCAIDFGTAYSGWAFSLKTDYERDPRNAQTKTWYSGYGQLSTEKTPTCLLLGPNRSFEAFGYEAENKYRELVENNLHTSYYYFRRFKILLLQKLGKGVNMTMTLEDEMGKSFPAIDVFSLSIKYLVDDMLSVIKTKVIGAIRTEECHWVITVPAIWSDSAKHFMREAASKAGIIRDQLTIALEPEAASLYCLHSQVETTSNAGLSKLSTGTKYMVLDAGGGTIDITVHEVQSTNTLREVTAAEGGGWGGIMVDKSFETFLTSLVGEKVYEKFKHTETEDWLDICREFEHRKRDYKFDTSCQIRMRYPVSLSDLYEEETHQQINNTVNTPEYARSVEIKRDKIQLSHELFCNFFKSPIQKICEQVKAILTNERMQDVKVILMVGGFSESPLLQQAIKTAFPEKDVVIPTGASSAVLRGALIFGHDPVSVSERVLKYSYGIAVNNPFVEGKHREIKRRSTMSGDVCNDIFYKFIEKDSTVKTGETNVTKQFRVVENKHMICKFVVSLHSNPEYVDDEGCATVGNLVLALEDADLVGEKVVNLSMAFGGTEIFVQAENSKTGNKIAASIEYQG